ncbi:class C sortase [Corynebacterium uropygiale]|uniref:Class C sortase n=1 Tax=Corynebacterium uropygiale TaxID=1775911 RepID=A0A9X1U7J5_9CORY|nr:class C sortase [Corynebacterium uropygiale]MCF4006817.1 class C sortase [Corynebacterium uropygiale]
MKKTVTHDSSSTKDNRRRVWVTVLLVLVGLTIMLYPLVSTNWNNYVQNKASNEYAKFTQEQPEEVLKDRLASAREWNSRHRDTPILDPWLTQLDDTDPDYKDYLQQLNDAPAMAQLKIPSLDINLPIYHGSSEETLKHGVGHLYGSGLPIGGEGNHAVLTGHTGLSTATLFDNLKNINEKDAIYINVYNEKLKYEVHDIEIVLPEETDSLKPVEGQDLITLITCTPYGINSHRLLVHAHRVPLEPEDLEAMEKSGFHWQWWMYVSLLLGLIVLILLIRWIITNTKRQRSES